MPNQPAVGMAIAVDTRVAVITHDISSSPADRSPRIWGSTALAMVTFRVGSAAANVSDSRMNIC